MWVIRRGKTWGDDEEKMEVQLGWHDPQGKFHTLMSFIGSTIAGGGDELPADMMRIAMWCSFLNGGGQPEYSMDVSGTIDMGQWLDLT
jgi:hypothetical protein